MKRIYNQDIREKREIMELVFTTVFIFSLNIILACGRVAVLYSKCTFLTDCKCVKNSHSSLVKADCSGLGLTSIPRFPNIIEELILSKNKIKEIKDIDLQNKTHLKILDLSDNEIFQLKKSIFLGLPSLVYLSLRKNNLSARNESFINNPFEYLPSLTWLDLKNNFVSPYQPDVSSLISLETLEIDFISNGTGIMAPFFRNLKRLESLDISGLSGHCAVKSFNSDSFRYILHIKNLNISRCKIKSILKGTFAALKMIEVLDISMNTCLKFAVLENVTFDLQFSAIRIFKFNYIHKTFDMNTILKQSHIKYLTNTSIKEIHTDSNRCQKIERGALTYLPDTLEYASAKDNMCSVGPFLYDLFSLSIKTVDLSEMFKFHTKEKYVQHCDCDVVSVNSCHPDHVYDNEIFPSGLNLGEGIVPLPRTLIHITYRSSKLQYEPSSYTLSDNNLETVDLSNNILSAFRGPIYNTKALKYLDLSSNMCTELTTYFFSSDFLSLKELYLQNNLLGLVLPNDFNGDTFQHLHKLEKINLADNNIPTLSARFFRSQSSLNHLDLGNNILTGMHFDVVHMTNLSFLNLRNNRITFLDTNAQTQLDSVVAKNIKLQIDLGGNPLLCTCETIGFVKWMTTTKVSMRKKPEYKCQLANNTIIDLKDPGTLYRNLQKGCISLTPLIVGLASSIGMFIFILCTGLVYRYRWKLRYLYYMVKIRSHKPMSS